MNLLQATPSFGQRSAGMTTGALPAAQALVPWVTLALLVALPWITAALGLDYYLGFMRRVLIVAMAATGLNLLTGYAGMVALGHAGFVGVGAYTLVALQQTGIQSAWGLWSAATAGAAAMAGVIGALSLRTRGAYFIMITLAFAQMLYYVAVSLRVFGGDDGYNLVGRPTLPGRWSLDDESTFYWLVLALCVACCAGMQYLLATPFGRALCAARDNESRMTALGYPVYRIRLAAFTLAGAMAGLAGALLLTHNGFVSPSSMHWTQSATLLVMVVLGGLGRPWGAVVGVMVWMLLEEVLRQWTEYWHWPLGVLLVTIVLLAPQGLGALRIRGRTRALQAAHTDPP